VVVRDPDTGAAIRTGAGLPDVAVDANSGTIYVVWNDSCFSGGARDDVAFSKSTDGGLTWSMPIKVNQTPSGVAAFTPSVEVAADGTVGRRHLSATRRPPVTTSAAADMCGCGTQRQSARAHSRRKSWATE
jgi:hypothetical protein